MEKRRKYTQEFKEQAVELAGSIGMEEASVQLGIPKGSINNWRYGPGKVNQSSLLTSASEVRPENDVEELKRLRKEVQELKKVNHILKQAAAFFSQDHLK